VIYGPFGHEASLLAAIALGVAQRWALSTNQLETAWLSLAATNSLVDIVATREVYVANVGEILERARHERQR
jgi:hypothetical protein